MQPVDPRDGHARGEQTRHDQGSEFAAAADEHEDVARRKRAPSRGKHRGLLHHQLDPLGEHIGVAAVAQRDPAFFAFVTVVRRLFDGERLPKLDRPRSIKMMCSVRRRRFAQCERFRSDRLNHSVDDVEYRLRRAKARGDREVAEFVCPRLIGKEVVAGADGGRALLERFLGVWNLRGSDPWKP